MGGGECRRVSDPPLQLGKREKEEEGRLDEKRFIYGFIFGHLYTN